MSKVKQKYLPYAGIGSRKTPKAVLETMRYISSDLEAMGFILRTGGAAGADSAFLDGIQDVNNVELYLPWQGYNDYESDYHKVSKASIQMAAQYHPNWAACKDSVRKLHGRNCNIMAGPNVLKPMLSEFVICWTPHGSATGGTGMAITIADSFLIPVFDFGLGIDITMNQLERYIQEKY